MTLMFDSGVILLTPLSDQDIISPYSIYQYNINQISDENKEKYQFGDN